MPYGPMRGLVAFSFGLREPDDTGNFCNSRLADTVINIHDMETRDLAIVAQWEIAQILHRAYEDCLSVKPPSDGTYLDTEAVWGAAKVAFEPFGITEVIPVAQPFLHLRKIKKLMERDGYTVVDRHVGHIGFDRKSSQWWTRGYLQLIIYAILQTLTGLKGHRGKQSD